MREVATQYHKGSVYLCLFVYIYKHLEACTKAKFRKGPINVQKYEYDGAYIEIAKRYMLRNSINMKRNL